MNAVSQPPDKEVTTARWTSGMPTPVYQEDLHQIARIPPQQWQAQELAHTATAFATASSGEPGTPPSLHLEWPPSISELSS